MRPITDPTSLKPGDRLVSREGVEYKFIAYVPAATEDSKLVVLEVYTGYVATRRIDGRVYNDELCYKDVGFPSEKLTVWVNVYKNKGRIYGGVHVDRGEANAVSSFDQRLGGKAWALEIEV